MRCAKCQKLFDDMAHGSLPEAKARQVREHLASCPKCSVVWHENQALRCMLRRSAQPAAMPDAVYFARLARQAVAQVRAADCLVAAREGRSPGLFAAMAGLLTGLRFGVTGVVRATALLAVGVIVGYGISHSLKAGDAGTSSVPDRLAGARLVKSESPESKPILPVAQPGALVEPNVSGLLAGAGQKSEPIMKRDDLSAPAVDPTMLVQTWQKTVELLDKMPPSDEVERLRQIREVSRQVQSADLLTRLQDLKDHLVRTGQTAYIPDVHRIEGVVSQLASASREPRAFDFAHLDTYQQAEQALIEKQYAKALRLFQVVVMQGRGSYLAARATYQMGDMNFEHFRDYKNAFLDYRQCLEDYPLQFLSDAIQQQIHERVALITQNSMDDYAPLRTFAEASQTTQPAAAVTLYAALLKQYPQCSLVAKAIEATTRIARQSPDDTATVNQALEALEQFQVQNPSHASAIDAQLGLADITNFCVRNRSQAVIEYSKILEKTKDPEKIRIVQGRLRSLDRAR